MEQQFKIHIVQDLLNRLELYTIDNNKLSYFVRDINTPTNNKIMNDYLPTLRKFFNLPHHTRPPVKLTSQLLLRIFQDLDFIYTKKTKLYYKDGLKTTSGHYCYCFENNVGCEILKLLKQK